MILEETRLCRVSIGFFMPGLSALLRRSKNRYCFLIEMVSESFYHIEKGRMDEGPK